MSPPTNLLRPLIISLLILGFPVSWSMAADASNDGSAGASRTVALDPGHGGDENGARGPTGSLEKDICLDLVRALAGQLESEYRVVLTRSGDYRVKLRNRTATANHHQADLMISVHCGAGFMHAAAGMSVYYWKPDVSKVSQRPVNPNRWEQTQLAHLSASRAFALEMQQSLRHMTGTDTVRVRQAPLLVLQGAAMPAILIEIGYITHPATEKDLLSPQWRQQLVRAIQEGIHLFLDQEKVEGG